LVKYFPKFARLPYNLTFFDCLFDNVVDCNPKPKCRPIPIALGFNDTKNNRRRYKAFQEAANFDITTF
jgi:hypothetical protein